MADGLTRGIRELNEVLDDTNAAAAAADRAVRGEWALDGNTPGLTRGIAELTRVQDAKNRAFRKADTNIREGWEG